MALFLPHPSTVIDFAISTAGKAVGTAAAVASVPLRVLRLVNHAELLVGRVTTVVDDAEKAVVEARTIAASAQLTVEEAAQVSAAAAALIAQSNQIAGTASELIAGIPGFGMLRRRGEDKDPVA